MTRSPSHNYDTGNFSGNTITVEREREKDKEVDMFKNCAAKRGQVENGEKRENVLGCIREMSEIAIGGPISKEQTQ